MVSRVFLLLCLLQFLCQRVSSVAGHDPACRPGYKCFILESEKAKVIDAAGSR
jgi:hypothetical protein